MGRKKQNIPPSTNDISALQIRFLTFSVSIYERNLQCKSIGTKIQTVNPQPPPCYPVAAAAAARGCPRQLEQLGRGRETETLPRARAVNRCRRGRLRDRRGHRVGRVGRDVLTEDVVVFRRDEEVDVVLVARTRQEVVGPSRSSRL